MLKENDTAPASIEIVDAFNTPVSLADYRGKVVVLYFYPKDDTQGCTLEALAFESHAEKFKKLGVEVVGVSKDSCESHQKFAKKYKLNFSLWSDPDLTLQNAFGVWQEKKFMGRKYMGTVRATFIIGKDGTILKAYPKVSARGHAEAVYDFVKSL